MDSSYMDILSKSREERQSNFYKAKERVRDLEVRKVEHRTKEERGGKGKLVMMCGRQERRERCVVAPTSSSKLLTKFP